MSSCRPEKSRPAMAARAAKKNSAALHRAVVVHISNSVYRIHFQLFFAADWKWSCWIIIGLVFSPVLFTRTAMAHGVSQSSLGTLTFLQTFAIKLQLASADQQLVLVDCVPRASNQNVSWSFALTFTNNLFSSCKWSSQDFKNLHASCLASMPTWRWKVIIHA